MSNRDRYSPSLEGDLKAWKALVDFARDKDPRDVLQRAMRTFNNSKDEVDFREDGLDYIISSESERVKTLDELLDETEVDLKEFNVERYITNKWDQHSVDKGLVELYQVKAWMKRKYIEKPDPRWLDEWMNKSSHLIDKEVYSYQTPSSTKPLICALADLHTGGFSEGDKLIPDYNVDEVRSRLHYIAEVLNSYKRPIHIKLLGDLIESFTGKNHSNTWKQIEKHGMEVALVVFDILKEFILKLDHFESIDIIGGNHDRISSHWAEDKQGQVAYLIEGMLQRWIDGIASEFSPILLSKQHDGINYIITHGDKKITKKNASELVLKYGVQGIYNVLFHAHAHEEKVVKNTRELRVHQIPPICVPNKYAVENGYDGASGFVLAEANKFGRVDIATKGL